MEIPHPEDHTPPEYDAPPVRGERGKPLSAQQVRTSVVRPARAGVDNPSEKPRAGPLPEYHAPPPASSKRK